MNLTLNDQDCTVLNFSDISAIKRLKQVEEENKQITALSSSTHHEMLVPLKSNVEFAECLIRHLTQDDMKKKAQLILISSKLIMFHANDLLDMRFLQDGRFTPSYSNWSPTEAIMEIVDLIGMMLVETNLKIRFDDSLLKLKFPVLGLDKRRLQQVLLNLLSNATKFQTKGTIIVHAGVKININDLDNLRIVVSVIDEGIGIS